MAHTKCMCYGYKLACREATFQNFQPENAYGLYIQDLVRKEEGKEVIFAIWFINRPFLFSKALWVIAAPKK